MKPLYLLLPLLILIATSSAFPLNTSDNRVRILGMVPLSDGFALDIFTPEPKLAHSLTVEVVDPDDSFIKSYRSEDVANPSYFDRTLFSFQFDRPATQLKRIRIETTDGDVYSIAWAGVPEAFSKTIKVRLYNVTEKSNHPFGDQLAYKQYSFEVRVTNNLTQGLVLSPDDFWLVDQFNYGYVVRGDEYKLLPNESVRYTLTSQSMSPVSRPKLLVYLPDKLAMDLEGWY